MYNRYIRNDRGVYTRIPEPESSSPQSSPPAEKTAGFPDIPQHQQKTPPRAEPQPPPPPPRQSGSGFDDSISKTLRRLLDRFHLENVDTGDLLLLLLLFLLFKEDADEELLFALGLLLIL